EMTDGPSGPRPGWLLRVREELRQVGEYLNRIATAALGQTQRTGSPHRGRGILLPTPDRLQLNMAHASEEALGILVFQSDEGLGDGGLGQALRIPLFGIDQKAIEGGHEVRSQGPNAKFADHLGRCRRHVMGAVAKSLA